MVQVGNKASGVQSKVLLSTEAEIFSYFLSLLSLWERGRGWGENTAEFLLQYLQSYALYSWLGNPWGEELNGPSIYWWSLSVQSLAWRRT